MILRLALMFMILTNLTQIHSDIHLIFQTKTITLQEKSRTSLRSNQLKFATTDQTIIGSPLKAQSAAKKEFYMNQTFYRAHIKADEGKAVSSIQMSLYQYSFFTRTNLYGDRCKASKTSLICSIFSLIMERST